MTDDKIERMARAIREASLGVYMKDHPKNGLRVCFLCDEEAPIDEPIRHDEECGTPQAEDALAVVTDDSARVAAVLKALEKDYIPYCQTQAHTSPRVILTFNNIPDAEAFYEALAAMEAHDGGSHG